MRARLAGWITLVGAMSALLYYARFTEDNAASTTRNAVYRYSTFANGLVLYGIILAIVCVIAVDRWDLFALRRPRSWPRAAGIAILLWLLIIGWETAVVTRLPIENPGNEQGLTPTHWEASRAGAFAANCVLLVLIAPAIEELVFRGVGQSLLSFLGRWPSIVLVGIAFGLWHGLVEALVILVPFGIALSYLRDRTRSVLPGMVVHALFNGAALAASVLS
jgi:membrane protease YdiL (CAAX protease family)